MRRIITTTILLLAACGPTIESDAIDVSKPAAPSPIDEDDDEGSSGGSEGGSSFGGEFGTGGGSGGSEDESGSSSGGSSSDGTESSSEDTSGSSSDCAVELLGGAVQCACDFAPADPNLCGCSITADQCVCEGVVQPDEVCNPLPM